MYSMSEIKVILVLSFLMHIHRCYMYMYTMLLFLHFSKDVVMSQYMFKCSREITPASLMQLQHFIFTCLLQCKSAFSFFFQCMKLMVIFCISKRIHKDAFRVPFKVSFWLCVPQMIGQRKCHVLYGI